MVESVEAADTIGEVETMDETPTTLEKLQALLARSGKDRNSHLRKEQLSQGVLNAVLQSLGRLVLEQVHFVILLHNFTDKQTSHSHHRTPWW